MELSSGIAAFTAKEFGRAMQMLSPLAEAGEPEAQFRVAIMHQNGLGVVANPDKALQVMRAARCSMHAYCVTPPSHEPCTEVQASAIILAVALALTEAPI